MPQKLPRAPELLFRRQGEPHGAHPPAELRLLTADQKFIHTRGTRSPGEHSTS